MEHTGKRALVLAGGGAKGSYQIGVWHALQALDWTPDIITGASVGTLNGCLFTMGKAREAEELWRSLEIHDVLEVPESLKREELRNFFLDIFRSGGLNVEPLAETIDRLIDEDAVTAYDLHPSPTRCPVFNPGKTSRINVAHFMADLIDDGPAWTRWQGQMPVIYNRTAQKQLRNQNAERFPSES